jgi:hypothetical protein
MNNEIAVPAARHGNNAVEAAPLGPPTVGMDDMLQPLEARGPIKLIFFHMYAAAGAYALLVNDEPVGMVHRIEATLAIDHLFISKFESLTPRARKAPAG